MLETWKTEKLLSAHLNPSTADILPNFHQVIMRVFWENGSCLVVPGFLGKNGLPVEMFTSPFVF